MARFAAETEDNRSWVIYDSIEDAHVKNMHGMMRIFYNAKNADKAAKLLNKEHEATRLAGYDSVEAVKTATIDCRSEEGITIGLIDSVIAIARIAVKRDTSHPAIQEALKDLRADADVRNLVDNPFAAALLKGNRL